MYILNNRNVKRFELTNKEWQNYYGNLCYPKTRAMRLHTDSDTLWRI